MKEIILKAVRYSVNSFLYYDRKFDQELEIDNIENMVIDGTMTVDEIAEAFKNELDLQVKKYIDENK